MRYNNDCALLKGLVCPKGATPRGKNSEDSEEVRGCDTPGRFATDECG